jgi:hypothetical protein
MPAVNYARAAAYQEYLDYITNAWRTKPARVWTLAQVRRGYDEPPDRHRFDGMTVDEISRCHQQNMRRIYDQVDRELSEAWKQR